MYGLKKSRINNLVNPGQARIKYQKSGQNVS